MNTIYLVIYILLIAPLVLLIDAQNESPIMEYLGNRFNYFSRKTRQFGLLFIRRILQAR